MLPEFMQQELDESQESPDSRRALQAACAVEASQGYTVEYGWQEDCFPPSDLSLSSRVEVGLLHLLQTRVASLLLYGKDRALAPVGRSDRHPLQKETYSCNQSVW